MNSVMILLHLVHILAGIFWFGGAVISAAQLAEMHGLQKRLGTAGLWLAVLVVISAATMAMARYM